VHQIRGRLLYRWHHHPSSLQPASGVDVASSGSLAMEIRYEFTDFEIRRINGAIGRPRKLCRDHANFGFRTLMSTPMSSTRANFVARSSRPDLPKAAHRGRG
jgi:hypothetical protein